MYRRFQNRRTVRAEFAYKKLRRKVRGYSSEEFIQDLKRGGCTVGEGTFFFNPRETFIDNVKPWLISIGSYYKLYMSF